MANILSQEEIDRILFSIDNEKNILNSELWIKECNKNIDKNKNLLITIETIKKMNQEELDRLFGLIIEQFKELHRVIQSNGYKYRNLISLIELLEQNKTLDIFNKEDNEE